MAKPVTFQKGRPATKGRPPRNVKPGARKPDARRAALEVLDGLKDAPVGSLADRLSKASQPLEARDRGFVRVLVLETLRRHGQITQLMNACLSKGKPPTETLGWILKLGICQLMFLDTAPHAAVDGSVRLAPKQFTGLVNAILRRIGREGAAWRDAQDAARLNTPDWLWHRWVRAYGEDGAKAIADAHLIPAALDLTVKSDAERWAETLGAELLSTGTLRLSATGEVSKLPGYGDGAWWVQDAAALLPAKLLGDVTGKTVIDLCAAPGGKALQLAAAGAEVTAVDSSTVRMKRLAENFTRMQLSCTQVVADAADWRPAEPVDAVLLDAPCSATGTLRRHPDLVLLKAAGDEAGLLKIQEQLFDAAWAMLKPGGTLVYCTCSLDPKEGEAQAEAFLKRTPNASLAPVSPEELGGRAELITAKGELRTLPNHGIDGFYAGRFIKGSAA